MSRHFNLFRIFIKGLIQNAIKGYNLNSTCHTNRTSAGDYTIKENHSHNRNNKMEIFTKRGFATLIVEWCCFRRVAGAHPLSRRSSLQELSVIRASLWKRKSMRIQSPPADERSNSLFFRRSTHFSVIFYLWFSSTGAQCDHSTILEGECYHLAATAGWQ